MMLGAAVLALLVSAGCRQDMHDQPYYRPLTESDFFPDQRAARSIPAGAVARGNLRADTYFYTGMIHGQPGNEIPFPVDEQLLRRGQQRFNIYCSPCHGMTGEGNGMIVQRGYRRPPSYHIDRLRKAPAGYFFEIMTNGFGAMPDYAAQVPPADRWAIVSYIRALQFSQSASVNDVPPEERGRMKPLGQRPTGDSAREGVTPGAATTAVGQEQPPPPPGRPQ